MLIATEKIEEARNYWLNKFSEELTEIKLTRDLAGSKSYEKATFPVNIGETETGDILNISRDNHLSIYVILLAVFKALLFKITKNGDIVVASPTYIKSSQESNNFVLFRDLLFPQMTFKDILIDVKRTVEEGYKKQYFPVKKLIQLLEIKNNLSLFRYILVLESIHRVESVNDIIDEYENDLVLFFKLNGKKLEGELIYNANLFKPETIASFWDKYLLILSQVMKNKSIETGDIDFISEKEKNTILYTFNKTEIEYPSSSTLQKLFEDQVEKTPGSIALIGHQYLNASSEEDISQLSYRMLNEKSNQLARLLLSKGVKPNAIIGVMLSSSIEMIVGIMGILKAGGAFLPIEVSTPANRFSYLIQDCGVEILIHDGRNHFSKGFLLDDIDISSHLPCITDENSSNLDLNSDNYAYVIYTSGTTGKPKGTLIRHRNAVNTLLCRKENYKLDRDDTTIQLFSFAFDGFITSFFTPIISGSRVVLPTEEGRKDISRVSEMIPQHRVTHFICVPQLFLGIIENLTPSGARTLRVVTLAGDCISSNIIDLAKEKNDNLEIANEYGVTEVSVMSTLYRNQEKRTQISIGAPVWNTHIYIVDEKKLMQPIGVPGELCIAGAGVFDGYLNNPELTAEKIIANPFIQDNSTFNKMYRTGDLGRWLPDGNIELLGRMDHQVKIRGLRIELEEIEKKLLNCEGIKESRVIALQDDSGDKYLCAYVVANELVEISALKEFLSRLLPDYMVPQYFVKLSRMPLTPTGKVDIKQLPLPEKNRGRSFEAPRELMEKKLANIWAQLLGLKIDGISMNDNFFELGGHSLKATILAAKIHKEFNIKVPLPVIFNNPILRDLSNFIKSASTESFISIEPTEKKEFYPLSSAQKRLYTMYEVNPESTVYNTTMSIPLEVSPDHEKLESIINELIDRHESLRTSFVIAGDSIVQRIHEPGEVILEIEFGFDRSIRDFVRAFDLSCAPLFRIGLIKEINGKYLLLVDMHHIITDGASHEVLKSEFNKLFSGMELSPLKLQYRDFSEWQNSFKQQESLKKQEECWLRIYNDELSVINLPTDYRRPLIQNFEGATVFFEISEEENIKMMELVKNNDVTLYIFLLALFNVLLSKVSGQEDIIVGSPVAARRHADIENVIGMITNTLAFRNYPQDNKTFRIFLEEVKQNTIEAFENQEYPFEELVSKVVKERDLSRNPVFDVMFNFSEKKGSRSKKHHINCSPELYDHISSISKFDLTLNCLHCDDEVLFSFEYCTKLFNAITIDVFIRYFKEIIQQVTDNINIPINEIDLVSLEEKEMVHDMINLMNQNINDVGFDI